MFGRIWQIVCGFRALDAQDHDRIGQSILDVYRQEFRSRADTEASQMALCQMDSALWTNVFNRTEAVGNAVVRSLAENSDDRIDQKTRSK